MNPYVEMVLPWQREEPSHIKMSPGDKWKTTESSSVPELNPFTKFWKRKLERVRAGWPPLPLVTPRVIINVKCRELSSQMPQTKFEDDLLSFFFCLESYPRLEQIWCHLPGNALGHGFWARLFLSNRSVHQLPLLRIFPVIRNKTKQNNNSGNVSFLNWLSHFHIFRENYMSINCFGGISNTGQPWNNRQKRSN